MSVNETLLLCPLCGSRDTAPRYRVPDRESDSPEEFAYSLCRNCSLVFLSERVRKENIGSYYRTDYEPFSASYNSLTERFIKWRTRREIAGWHREKPDIKDVLEVGSSWGKYLLAVRSEGAYRVVGVEPSREMCERGRALGLEMHEGDLSSAGLVSSSYDVVVMNHVIEHLYDPRATLVEVRRVLRSGGILYIKTPNVQSIERVFGRAWLPYEAPRHTLLFGPARLTSLLEEEGFKVRQVSYDISPNNLILSIRNYLSDRAAPEWLIKVFHLRSYPLLALLFPVSAILGIVGASGRMTLIAVRRNGETESFQAPALPRERLHRVLGFVLKLAISALLIRFIFTRIELRTIAAAFAHADFGLIVASVVVLFLANVVNVLKWRILVRAAGVKATFTRIFNVYFASFFYMMFLPGGQLTGEVVKIYQLARGEVRKSEVITSVFLDKVTGLAAFFILALAGFYFGSNDFTDAPRILAFLAVVLIASCGAVFLFTDPGIRLAVFLERAFQPFIERVKMTGIVRRVLDVLKGFRGKRAAITKSLCLGLVFQFGNTCSAYLVAQALGVSVSLTDLLWIYATVSLILLIPASVMGLGQRELSFIYFARLIGVPAAGSTALSLAVFATMIAMGLVGGGVEMVRVVATTRGRRRDSDSARVI